MNLLSKTAALALLLVAACDKPQANATTSTTAASTTSPATTAAPAKTADAPKAAFVQKGIKPGNVVVGYLEDSTDPSQCAVVTDKPEKKDQFKKDGPEVAKMMKAKLVDSCPTDKVVGSCDVGIGMIANYSGPKWTADTAKKDCLSKPHQKWVD